MPVTINGTTGIAGVDGSASTPAVQGSDTNTGVFYPAADTVGVSTGGSERMRVDSSGNVGIGTSSPSAKLDIAGSAGNVQFPSGGNEILFTRVGSNYISGSNGALNYQATQHIWGPYGLASEWMRINSSGNVGIGTSSPGTAGGGGSPRTLEVYNATGTVPWGQLVLSTGVAGTTNDIIAGIEFANRGVSGAAKRGAAIYAFKSSTSSVNADTHLTFSVNNSGTLSEAMRIDSSGNVQIGTTGGPAPINVFRSTNGNPVGIFKATSTSFDNDLLQLTCSRAGATTQYLALSFYTNNYGTLQAYMRADGNWYNANSVYGSTSDARLKENIIDATPKLDSLCQLKVRNFNFISDENKTKQIGFVAQEFEEVFPSMVDENKDGDKTIKTSVLIPMLVKAIQELKAELDTLNGTVDAQAAEIAALKAVKT